MMYNESVVNEKSSEMQVAQDQVKKQRKILIVDDNFHVVDVISRVLRRQHWDTIIETATGGIEALIKLNGFQPDLLIIDYRLPGINALEILNKANQKKHFSNLKTMLITGYNPEENKLELIQNGVREIMQKPLNLIDLTTKAAQLLNIQMHM